MKNGPRDRGSCEMKNRWLTWLAMAAWLLPGAAAATSVNLPLSWKSGGPYLAGFEVETMRDEVDGEGIEAHRYLARLSWRAFDNLGFSLRAGAAEMNIESTALLGQALMFEGEPKFAVGAGATYLRPLGREGLTLFADGQLLYTLTYGNTFDRQYTQSGSSIDNYYENRIAWDEYQGAFGVQLEIPWARFYTGALVRSVDGTSNWKTFDATGNLHSQGRRSFSREPSSYALLGVDIPFAKRMVFSVGGQGRSDTEYSWTISVAEYSR